MAGSESDFGEKLGAILNNPQAMSQIMALANSLSGNGAAPSSTPDPHPIHTQSTPGIASSTSGNRFSPENTPSAPLFPASEGENQRLGGENNGFSRDFGGAEQGWNGGGQNSSPGPNPYGAPHGFGGAGRGENSGGQNPSPGPNPYGAPSSGSFSPGSRENEGGNFPPPSNSTGNGTNGGDGQFPGGELPRLDPRLMAAGMKALSAYQATDDRRVALLNALRPFLSRERAPKIEKAIRIARLSKVARAALEGFKGGEGNV